MERCARWFHTVLVLASLALKISALSDRVYLCVSYNFHKKTATVSLNGVNEQAFVMETQCVSCEVGTEFLGRSLLTNFMMLSPS
jgi:hypothetical protein